MKNSFKKMFNNETKSALILLIIGLLVGSVSYAGSLTPSSSPSKTMYTLGDIYTLLTTGTTTASTNFTTPGSVTPTFYTLTDLVNAFSSSTQNLTAGNLKSGVTVLGVTGTFPVSHHLLQTGQSTCYDSSGNLISCAGTGEDGEFQKGLARSYTDNGNGTVTDNDTGLVWQQVPDGVNRTWSAALTYCNTNAAGLPGSGWRLPNVYELTSIVDFSKMAPSLNSTYFSSGANIYWTSTSFQYSGVTYDAMYVRFNIGYSVQYFKGNGAFVRCVRG